jgi:glycine cleavage system aminomethyltransferase T
MKSWSNIEAAGVVHADEDAFRIVRLEHGKPRYGEDISERYLAQEANQADALEKEARGVNGEVKLHSA